MIFKFCEFRKKIFHYLFFFSLQFHFDVFIDLESSLFTRT